MLSFFQPKGAKVFQRGVKCLRENDLEGAWVAFEEVAEDSSGIPPREKEYLMIAYYLLAGAAGRREDAKDCIEKIWYFGTIDGTIDKYLVEIAANAGGKTTGKLTPLRLKGRQVFFEIFVAKQLILTCLDKMPVDLDRIIEESIAGFGGSEEPA